MDFNEYIFRSHMVGKVINVPKPLTKTQNDTFVDYAAKGYENLTDKQQVTFASLKNKHNESKSFKLSDTNKKELSKLVYAHKYGRKTELNSPMISKGLEKEKESRDLLSRVTGIFLISSDERKSNDWVTGKTDIKIDGIVPDIKTTWSWESFSNILESKPNEIYLRQLDSYMDLWNVKDSVLCHTLVDTPSYLIESQIRRKDYQDNILDVEGNVRDENIEDILQIVTNHIFTRKGLEEFCLESSVVHLEWFEEFKEIPEQDRVHMIPHAYDETRIHQRNECIKLARKYMNTVKPINNFDPTIFDNA